MKINNALRELIGQSQLEENEALVFCFAIEYLGNSAIEWLIERGIVSVQNEYLFRINLLNKDHEEGTFVLREPLFSIDDSGLYGKFVSRLNGELGFTANGHPNNQMPYAVMNDDEYTKMSFDRVVSTINNFDLERLLTVTTKYYEKTERCRGLGKYLEENAKYDYQSYGTTNQSRVI